MTNYDRNAAAAYASKYALTENPSYPAFDNDCTAFVSQALLAGGWTMVGGSFWDRKEDGVWWYGKSDVPGVRASYTWGGAQNFSQFIAKSGRGKICPRADLVVGDIVQIKDSRRVFHTMMVTAIMCSSGGDGPHLSYHTTNTHNKALSLIEKKAASDDSFLYWKVLDIF